jgi:predicted nucleic acid-binding protein
MTAPPVYLDTSAIVKLVSREPETAALAEALTAWPERLSSALARVELHRAVRRAGLGLPARRRAEAVLAAIALVHVDETVLRLAASLRDRTLRSLDAIHLATALSLGDLPALFVTYDARQKAAAAALRLDVRSPGA